MIAFYYFQKGRRPSEKSSRELDTIDHLCLRVNHLSGVHSHKHKGAHPPWEILPLDGGKSVHGVANLSSGASEQQTSSRRQRGRTLEDKHGCYILLFFSPFWISPLYEEDFSKQQPSVVPWRSTAGTRLLHAQLPCKCYLVCARSASLYMQQAWPTEESEARVHVSVKKKKDSRITDADIWMSNNNCFRSDETRGETWSSKTEAPPWTLEIRVLGNIWKMMTGDHTFNEENNIRRCESVFRLNSRYETAELRTWCESHKKKKTRGKANSPFKIQ